MKDKIEKIIDRFRSSLDGEISIYSMADYIFELEKRLQNTTDNSDYAKCSHELLDNLLGNYSSEQHMKAMLILKSHFV